jgi:hypothetical protein
MAKHRCQEKTRTEAVVKGCKVVAKKILEIPSRCVKVRDYSTKNYESFGSEGRFVGAWQLTSLLPEQFGGTRENVAVLNLGGTITMTSTLVPPVPGTFTSSRNMYQGEWQIAGKNLEGNLVVTGILSIYFYDEEGFAVAVQRAKVEATLSKDPVNPLYDTMTANATITFSTFVFLDGDKSKSIIGEIPQGPPFEVQNTLIRLTALPQFSNSATQEPAGLKNVYNQCYRC